MSILVGKTITYGTIPKKVGVVYKTQDIFLDRNIILVSSYTYNSEQINKHIHISVCSFLIPIQFIKD